MKIHLSTKFTITYIIISSLLFTVSAILIYQYIREEVDEKVRWKLEADRDRIIDMAENNSMQDSIEIYHFEDLISEQYVTIREVGHDKSVSEEVKDTLLPTMIFGQYSDRPYKQMRFYIRMDDQTYEVTLRQQLVEAMDLSEGIINPLIYVFIALLVLMTVINLIISKRIWAPFYSTINRITNYKFTGKEALSLKKSRVKEFDILNESIAGMSEKIRRDYKSLKEFTENLAHEVQTPLAVMMSKLELLMQSEMISLEQSEHISSLNESVMKLNRLNQSLILIARIENEQFQNVCSVNLKNEIESVLKNYEDLVEARGLQLIISLDPDTSLEMEQVLAEVLFSNLLSNAVKYATPQTQIYVTLMSDELVIDNSGEPFDGNPEEFFNRFTHGSKISNSLGLGLSITKSICQYYDLNISYRIDKDRHILTIKF